MADIADRQSGGTQLLMSGAARARMGVRPVVSNLFEELYPEANGATWNGTRWSEASVSAGTIDVQSGRGRISPTGTNSWGRGVPVMTAVADAGILASVQLGVVATNYMQVGVRRSGGWATINYLPQFGYSFEFGSTTVKLQVEDNGGWSQIASQAYTKTTGLRWVRLEAQGTTVRGRWWEDGAAEPGTWNMSVTDTVNASGTGFVAFGTGASGEMFFDNVTMYAL